MQIYSENLNIDDSVDSSYREEEGQYEANGETCVEDDVRNIESEDEEDDKPLEQVRKSLQSSANEDDSRRVLDEDKEEQELNECLKKIHNFKCTTCNKAFNSRTALGYHLKTHNTGSHVLLHFEVSELIS